MLPPILGQVLAAKDSVAVPGALIEALGTDARALTDADGRFILRRSRAGDLPVTVRVMGYAPDTSVVEAVSGSVTVYLTRAAITLEAVEVEAAQVQARVRFDELAQLSTTTLSGSEIKRVPGILESDVIRAVMLLPGTVTKSDYSIGYNVRGGESDQNLIQVDGIPVFNPSHLAGLFSTFDADAIDHADFLTGGFPAGYSGRLSSILDIGLRTGATHLRASSHVSLLSSKVYVEGPLPFGSSFLISGRRTYMDQVVAALTSYTLPYYFSDLLGKLSVPTGDGSVSVTGYWGRDAFNLNLVAADTLRDAVDLAWKWGNRFAVANWSQPVGFAEGHVEARAGVSDYFGIIGLLPNLVSWDNSARLYAGSMALALAPWDGHALRLGAGVERYETADSIVSQALQVTLQRSRHRPTVWSAFVDEQWAPNPRVMLRPGVRVEYVPSHNGFAGISPRVAAKYFITGSAAITGSAGRYFQAVHSIRDQELPITLNESWIAADKFIPVGRSDHFVLGLETWFGRDLQLTVEGYAKTFYNLVSPNRGQSLDRSGDEYVPTTGRSAGFDVLLRRHAGKIRGWMAYSFVRAKRTAEGVTYPPAHDRRHTLNVVLEAPGPLGAQMTARWGFGSPLPYTAFTGLWFHRIYDITDHRFDGYNEEPVAGPRNGARYPPYTRLDVGMRWSFRKWGANWEPYFQVVNAYNRKNAFLYFFDFESAPPTRTGVSQLPFLPTFGLEIRF